MLEVIVYEYILNALNFKSRYAKKIFVQPSNKAFDKDKFENQIIAILKLHNTFVSRVFCLKET